MTDPKQTPVLEMGANLILHILRNSYGYTNDKNREARIAAANLIEYLMADRDALHAKDKQSCELNISLIHDCERLTDERDAALKALAELLAASDHLEIADRSERLEARHRYERAHQAARALAQGRA